MIGRWLAALNSPLPVIKTHFSLGGLPSRWCQR
jgi:hypothetical protein